MDSFTPSRWVALMRASVRLRRLIPLFPLFAFSFGAFAQTCTVNSTTPSVHSEGLAERVGDVIVSCSGGTAAANVSLSLFVTLNTNITNRLDSNGAPTGISVTVNTGAGAVASGTQTLNSATTLFVNGVNYSVPAVPATPAVVTVSGIRAAAGLLSNGTGVPVITATVAGVGAQFAATPAIPVALSSLSLLTSTLNNGVPCVGSPLPSTLDFPSFINVNANSSVVRITEASPAAFIPRQAGSDSGTRILVKLSGYTTASRVFVPDAIVGVGPGATPTSAGGFNTTISPGVYVPGNNELLLLRVNGADANGAGGTLAMSLPVTATNFSSVSEVALAGGSGYAVYEVADSNTGIKETAQIPIFLAVSSVACTGPIPLPVLSAVLAPVSNVAVATASDPVPRFIATTPGSDCQQNGDCSGSYFPHLSVNATPISLTGAALGNRQGGSINVANSGGGFLNYSATVAYPSGYTGANWLSVTPASGQNNASLQIYADPGMLQPGTYTATVTINAGSVGTANVPVTFAVGQPGVTILNVGNAASFQYGTVAPGSYAVLFGANLGSASAGVSGLGVTFNGLPAQVVFGNATQINLLVPTQLGTQALADVVATVDGKVSNSFRVNLALNAPGIFSNGVVNFDDNVINGVSAPVKRGTYIVIYLTGLTIPLTGDLTVNIGNQLNLEPAYKGPQGTYPGLDQVNIVVPASLAATPNPVPLTICIPGPAGAPVCSNSVNLYIK
jgi:uncharacterized protein (TIGR03437 family)